MSENTGKKRKNPKQWRAFGAVNVIDSMGNIKQVAPKAWVRVDKATKAPVLGNHDIKKSVVKGQKKEKGEIIYFKEEKNK